MPCIYPIEIPPLPPSSSPYLFSFSECQTAASDSTKMTLPRTVVHPCKHENARGQLRVQGTTGLGENSPSQRVAASRSVHASFKKNSESTSVGVVSESNDYFRTCLLFKNILIFF